MQYTHTMYLAFHAASSNSRFAPELDLPHVLWMVGLDEPRAMFGWGASVQAINVREENQQIGVDRSSNLSREFVIVWDTQCLCVRVCV